MKSTFRLQGEDTGIFPCKLIENVPVPCTWASIVGYGYSILEEPPHLLAHVRLGGVWLRLTFVTLYTEHPTIKARMANKH